MGRKRTTVNPSLRAYDFPTVEPYSAPQALTTEVGTANQIRRDESTYIWGIDDALPVRILRAVSDSPTTQACIEMRENFIRGASFTDTGLMDMPIDKYGTTLWELHRQLCVYYTLLDGFAVNFKMNSNATITNTYNIEYESCRFVAPAEGVRKISEIKVNPYFGTLEYNRSEDYTRCYPVWDGDKAAVQAQMDKLGDKYPGQLYFFGEKRPLYKHYPVPKYWSGERAIYADAKMMEFVTNGLENGFFQSVWITMIGDPDAPSTNPDLQTTETGTDQVKRKRSLKTKGQEFDEYMKSTATGTKKSHTAFVTWAANDGVVPKIQAFPSNLNFDLMNGTDVINMRKITIATQVPAILVNLPQQENSLGSDGNAIEWSIELMQSRTAHKRTTLEQFYNKILLPNLETKTSAKVEIKPYRPLAAPVTIEDKFWEALPAESKLDFIRKNFPDIPIAAGAVAPATPQPAQPMQSDDPMDSFLRKLTRRELANFYGYVNDYKKGRANLEQTMIFLKPFGLTDEQMKLFLNDTPDSTTVPQ